ARRRRGSPDDRGVPRRTRSGGARDARRQAPSAMTRMAGAAVALLALVLVAPGPASATTATLVFEEGIPGVVESAYVLTVRAGPGETNRIGVSEGNGAYAVADTGAVIHAGAGCTGVGPNRLRCPTPRQARDRSVFM